MKFRLVVLFSLVLALALALSACGGGIETPTTTAGADTTATTAASGSSDSSATTASTAAPSGEVFEFNLQNHDSPTGATAQFLDAWAAAIKEASNGRIIINNFHGGSLGGPKDSYNMVLDGTVDIAWGLPSFSPGLFPATDAIALPFIGVKTSLQASYALWELYDTTDYLKPEWSKVKVLLLHTNCDAPLITDKKITSVNDLKGMNMRINAGPPTEWAKLVGANPMNIGIGDVYAAMEKGVVDGVTSTGWDVVNAFKFYEQGDFFLDYAIHVNPYFLVMNTNSYNKLPDDLKAIMDQFSGYGALEIVGSRWADVKADVLNKINEAGKELYTLPAEEMAKFEDLGAQAREVWMADLKGKGIDADGLVAKTMELLDKHQDK